MQTYHFPIAWFAHEPGSVGGMGGKAGGLSFAARLKAKKKKAEINAATTAIMGYGTAAAEELCSGVPPKQPWRAPPPKERTVDSSSIWCCGRPFSFEETTRVDSSSWCP